MREAHAPLAGGRACRQALPVDQHVSESGPRSAVTPWLSAPPAHRRTGRVSQGLGSIRACLTATRLRSTGPAILGGRGLDKASYPICQTIVGRGRVSEKAGVWGPRLSLSGIKLRRRGVRQVPFGHELVVRLRAGPVAMHRAGPLGVALDVTTTGALGHTLAGCMRSSGGRSAHERRRYTHLTTGGIPRGSMNFA